MPQTNENGRSVPNSKSFDNIIDGKDSPIIKQINRDAVHRICSGQVVLNLAVGVKELVENAIDAGAANIEIKLKEYGSELIEVIDNGSGVSEENFNTLTLKHYTSKLSEFIDLESIETLGFRGEALSSLCALSDVTITTRHRTTDVATRIEYDHNGKIIKTSNTSRSEGTTVTLANIFSTLPVRRKEFLKNLKREFNKMCQLLYAYCLVCVNIKITCTNQVKNAKTTVMATQASGSVRENIINVFGAKQISSLIDIVVAEPNEAFLEEYGLKMVPNEKIPFSFECFLSSVTHGNGRSTSDRQFYYINSRPCEPTKVMKLVNEIYRQYNNNQYPFVYLNILINRNHTDINVTPDKRQIFLDNETLLLAILKSSLVEAFKNFPSTYALQNINTKRAADKINHLSKTSKRTANHDSDAASPSSLFQHFTKKIKKNELNEDCKNVPLLLSAAENVNSLCIDNSFPNNKDRNCIDLNPLKNLNKSSTDKNTVVNEDSDLVCTFKLEKSEKLKEFKASNENTISVNNIPILNINTNSMEKSETTGNILIENHDKNITADLQNDPTIMLNTSITSTRNTQRENHDKKVTADLQNGPTVVLNTSIALLEQTIKSKIQHSENWCNEGGLIKFKSQINPNCNKEAEQELQKQITKDKFKQMKIIGQFNLAFIVTQLENDLFIIDQHASDEKYNFEQLQMNTILETQALVNPKPLYLTAANEHLLIENEDKFKKNGFVFSIDNTEENTPLNTDRASFDPYHFSESSECSIMSGTTNKLHDEYPITSNHYDTASRTISEDIEYIPHSDSNFMQDPFTAPTKTFSLNLNPTSETKEYMPEPVTHGALDETSSSDSKSTEYIPETTSDSEATPSDSETAEYFFRGDIDSENVGNVPHSQTDQQTKNIDNRIVRFSEITRKAASENIEHFTNSRPWTKKNSCPYCFQEITHFSRHLQRNHKEEGAVKEFLTLPPLDARRKQIINLIRKQGNFAYSSNSNIVKPVRRPRNLDEENDCPLQENEKYVICPDCFGFYKRNFLRRHRKNCKVKEKSGARRNHLSEAQMFKICNGPSCDFYSSLRLKDEVFTIMRADTISQVAIKDPLICSYAESLLKKHKRQQIRTTVSNKMRELGRLVISLKDVTRIESLFDALKPEYFDNIVCATKTISGYDVLNKTYKAASLALHMGTTLRQVCDIATKMIIKNNRFFPCDDKEISLKNIKRLKHLLINHWNSEVSSLALKDLNEKHWEKPKLFPLTSSVIKFHNYLMLNGKEAYNKLLKGEDLNREFRRLTEIVLSLTLLLNRKRIGEVQYLKVNTYNREISFNTQQELLQTLSDSEKILTQNFKRVVTGGKGSKPVAILFPKDIQDFIELLLSVRDTCVPKTNEYLFANPKTDNRWINGYSTVQKLAKDSGVEDTRLFTSTRLRKQIATVLQVINITDSEIEQFAAFMGHTKKTHETYYRLPQDIYQTAKVSKLLLAISKGKIAEYQGKSLDEIVLSDNVETDESDNDGESLNSEQNEIQNQPSTSKVAGPTKKVSLTAIPVSKNYLFGKDDIDELLFMLQEGNETVCRPSRVRQMFASRACRKSVMVGKALTHGDMKKIVDHMGEIDQPWNCPHGRPTMRHLLNLNLIQEE